MSENNENSRDSEDRCPHGKEKHIPCINCFIELKGVSEVTDDILDEFNAAKGFFELGQRFAGGKDIGKAELPPNIKIHDGLSLDQARQVILGAESSEKLNQQDS